jgi:hypothetical protein
MIGSYSFNPQLNPQKLLPCCVHPNGGQELALCCPSLVAVFLRVQIQRRLNFGVTQDALNVLRFDFRLVHQPVAQAVTQL